MQAITDVNKTIISSYAYTAWGERKLLSGGNITDRGYTGHEHLEAFGLINMNGRMYDPVLARFLSPDPYVQSPDNTQSLNRYSYCLNNPFKYTDPSGKFWNFVIAAGIGGAINLVSQIAAGNVANMGDAFKAFGIGALAGLVGAGAGALASSAIGLTSGVGAAQGAIIGAAGGAGGGFVGGAGNALFTGATMGDALMAGVKGAGMGSLAGGIFGGLSSGINSLENGGDFWTGDGYTMAEYATDASGNSIKTGKGMTYDKNYTDNFIKNNNIKAPSQLNKLYADGTIPPSNTANSYTQNGDNVLLNGQSVRGVTRFNFSAKNADVFLFKSAYVSTDQLYLTTTHEFTHINMTFNAGGKIFSETQQHRTIYKIQLKQYKTWNAFDSLYPGPHNLYNLTVPQAQFQFFDDMAMPCPGAYEKFDIYSIIQHPF